MIRAMDKLSVNNGVSTYLIAEMENLVKELPNSAASHDEISMPPWTLWQR
jgi:hypothetical protein